MLAVLKRRRVPPRILPHALSGGASVSHRAYHLSVVAQFVEDLAKMPVEEATNPFQGFHAPGSPAAQRAAHLFAYLRTLTMRPVPALLVGEASSARGMRVTGIPFTCQRTIETNEYFAHQFPLVKAAYSPSREPDAPQWEMSAGIVWPAVARAFPSEAPAFWNIVPVHPHPAGEPWTNRTPRPEEVTQGLEFTRRLIRVLQPGCVVAVGKVAHRALEKAGIEAVPVRHPSHGGGPEFNRGLVAVGKGATRRVAQDGQG